MKTVWILLLQYSPRYSKECERDLQEFACRHFNGHKTFFLTIDNGLKCNLDAKLTAEKYLISGDQSNWEFSGYDCGINYIKSNFLWTPDDVVLISNDTFNRSYGKSYLTLYNKKSPSALTGYFVSGYGDSYPEKVRLNGDYFQKWFRSSFLITNFMTLSKIGPFQIPFETKQIFSDQYPRFFLENDFLSDNYKSYLKSWLFDFQANNDFPHQWHSKQTLTKDNFIFLQNKARSILAEHFFSVRVQKNHSIKQEYINDI